MTSLWWPPLKFQSRWEISQEHFQLRILTNNIPFYKYERRLEARNRAFRALPRLTMVFKLFYWAFVILINLFEFVGNYHGEFEYQDPKSEDEMWVSLSISWHWSLEKKIGMSQQSVLNPIYFRFWFFLNHVIKWLFFILALILLT